MTKFNGPALSPERLYDSERIDRFISKTLGPSEDGPDWEATMAAADLLMDLLEDIALGENIRKRFTEMGYRKTPAYSPRNAALTGPHIEIAGRYADKKITRQEAIQELGRLEPLAYDTLDEHLTILTKRFIEKRPYIEMILRIGREHRTKK